jgi:hypothetical protein
MSATIVILDNEDLPCNDWSKELNVSCPMKEKWHEGQVRMCPECGWKIGYNTTEEPY